MQLSEMHGTGRVKMISYIGYITCRYEQLTKVFFVVATKIVSQSATPFKTKSTSQCFPKSF